MAAVSRLAIRSPPPARAFSVRRSRNWPRCRKESAPSSVFVPTEVSAPSRCCNIERPAPRRRFSSFTSRIHREHGALGAVVLGPRLLKFRKRRGRGGDFEAAWHGCLKEAADGVDEAVEADAADTAAHHFDRRGA